MATYYSVIETSTGDLLKVGYCNFTSDGWFNAGIHTQRTDSPFPGKVRGDLSNAQMHRWNGASWALVANVYPEYDSTAFNELSPMTTKGDLLVRNATVTTRLPVGTNGQRLQADSTQASGLIWTTPTNANFGTEFQSASSLTESSTTSITFVQKLKLTTTVLPAGNYMICANIAAKSNANNKTTEVQIQIDDTTVIYTMQARNDQYMQVGLFGRVQAFTAGSHTIDIDYRSVDALTSYIRDAEIVIWRVN